MQHRARHEEGAFLEARRAVDQPSAAHRDRQRGGDRHLPARARGRIAEQPQRRSGEDERQDGTHHAAAKGQGREQRRPAADPQVFQERRGPDAQRRRLQQCQRHRTGRDQDDAAPAERHQLGGRGGAAEHVASPGDTAQRQRERHQDAPAQQIVDEIRECLHATAR
jgi:hypothetical protein